MNKNLLIAINNLFDTMIESGKIKNIKNGEPYKENSPEYNTIKLMIESKFGKVTSQVVNIMMENYKNSTDIINKITPKLNKKMPSIIANEIDIIDAELENTGKYGEYPKIVSTTAVVSDNVGNTYRQGCLQTSEQIELKAQNDYQTVESLDDNQVGLSISS